MAMAIDRPMLDQSEKRPPTPSSNAKQQPAPKDSTAAVLALKATKWRATSPPPCARNHARAEAAFCIVSAVPKVLEAMMNSVLSACRRGSSSASSWPSMLAMKCTRGPLAWPLERSA